MSDDSPLVDLAKIAPDAPISSTTGIAAIALQMAMKYHDMSMIKDGALYQQYKLEGRNITNIDLSDVFETAIRIEAHLLQAEDRIVELLVNSIVPEETDEDQITPTKGD